MSMPARVVANRLCDYVDELRDAKDSWRLRVVLHDFGHVWAQASVDVRPRLIADRPDSTGNRRWDAFLAAYAEHLAYHARVDAPEWVFEDERYLSSWWIPLGELDTLRVEAIVHAPAAFEAHGILIARRELEVA